MSLRPTTADAITASVRCAERLGLACDDPVVVAEGYSVRVWLRPSPVLSRVVTQGRELRPEPLAWMRREVDVAAFLARAGSRVAAPWYEPGPHLVDGLEVSLWRQVPHGPPAIGPAVFGRALHDLHDALSGYRVELPLLVGPLSDISTALERCDDPVLHRAAARLLPQVDTWPRRPLHGDAHLGNLLSTESGPVWIDFEDTCSGPLEWDLASLTIDSAGAEAYAAAGTSVDLSRLALCRDLRRVQVLAALLVGWEATEAEVELRRDLARALESAPVA